MLPELQYGIVGGIGGLIRASVGVRKAMLNDKPFKPWYFLVTVVNAVVIGAVLGLFVGTTNLLALTAGYAGTDLLEGLAKAAKIGKHL